MATIRLNLSKELERMLRELKEQRFSLLENAEIIRVILSEYYAGYRGREEQRIRDWEASLPEIKLSKEEWKSIEEARKGPFKEMTLEELRREVQSE